MGLDIKYRSLLASPSNRNIDFNQLQTCNLPPWHFNPLSIIYALLATRMAGNVNHHVGWAYETDKLGDFFCRTRRGGYLFDLGKDSLFAWGTVVK